MQSMKLKDYFKLQKPTYKYIKIIPHKSIRNYNSSNIAKAMTHTYKNITKRIRKEEKKLIIECRHKISYIIDITKDDISFYFMYPEFFENILMEKVKETWPKATIEKLDSINPLSEDKCIYELQYIKEDALSLRVDKKSNEPLNSILNILEIMKDDDRVSIVYNFIPVSQRGWRKMYKDTIEKVNNNELVDKEKFNAKYIGLSIANFLLDFIEGTKNAMSELMGNDIKKEEDNSLRAFINGYEDRKELSNTTKKKKDNRIIDTQIAVISSSKDVTRRENNAISICQAYNVIKEDNELAYKKVKKDFNLDDVIFPIEVNKFSVDECSNFLQVPGRELLKEHGIKHINTTETLIPKELQQGIKSLGEVTYRGSKTKAYFQDEYNIGNLPLVAIGAQGSGKTSYLKNYSKYCNKAKEGLIVLDFIKNCELSDDIEKTVRKEDLIVLDLAKEEDIQGFGFNEITLKDDMSNFDKLNLASLQAQQVMDFVDSISIGDPLSSRMRRILSAAANVVFVQGYTSVKEVISCLEDDIIRSRMISNLDDELKETLEDDIRTLNELNDYDKNGLIIGTKHSKIEHILDRISMLREDFKLKFMYNKSTKNNINLINLMEEGKVLLIKMKESDFPTKMIKNILITYWISKIWLASQIRGQLNEKPLRCNILIDEVFQAPTSMRKLEYILPQSRKFGSKFIFTTQYIRQLDGIFDTLEASGSSYMLLKGCNENDFNHFKSKLNEYEYEDLRDMKQFHSLNLIYYSGGYGSFISKLPPPIK
ncbi:hypothetical protein [Hathewaya massiliensis]|uniref:hypothetical protein n=1 Tax=Hathewaya massiliensis TaxID=1964382 RepID=UPI00115ADE89|nr:hypothetical protein [Hathewaya massiliensis]